jgi:dTDP-glucose 4,6-dehydratase
MISTHRPQPRTLVTGGAGFIGSALCRALVGDGVEVCNFDKLSYAGNLSSLKSIASAPNYRFICGDVADAEALSFVLADFQPDHIFHLAAESHVDRSIRGAAPFIETNIVGTFQVLEATRAYWQSLPDERKESFRLLHISTDEVYGSLGPNGAFSEDSRYEPSSPYAASKAAADHLVMAWVRTYSLPALISNCSNNYGPFQHPEKLIPLAILNALNGQAIPVYGNGMNVRDWLHVDDHVDALRAILSRGKIGRKYNVGGRDEATNLSIVNRLCEILDKLHPYGAPHARLITYVEDRLGHDLRYAVDPLRIEHELEWRARRSLDTDLESVVQWYAANKGWWRPLWDCG